jgi:arylsulfatase A-like enzyme
VAARKRKIGLLVTLDSLRRDACGCYGQPLATTPCLDRLASEGLLFGDAFSTGPSTPPSFGSLLTGVYPLEYGGYAGLPSEKPALAEHLAQQGVWTIGVHSNPYLSEHYGYQRGFAVFEDFFEPAAERARPVRRGLTARALRVARRQARRLSSKAGLAEKPYASGEAVNEIALAALEESDGDVFLWFHYMEPHHPFHPAKKLTDALGVTPVVGERQVEIERRLHDKSALGKAEIEDLWHLYLAEVRGADALLQAFLEAAAPRLDDAATLLAVTADHGEAFGEHGTFSHLAQLFDELLRVPLVLWGSGVAATRGGGGASASPSGHAGLVETRDLARTFTDFFAVADDERMGGKSLLRRAAEGDSAKTVFAECLSRQGRVDMKGEGREILSVRTETHKLVLDEESGSAALFDLQADPQERRDIFDEDRVTAKVLQTVASEHRRRRATGTFTMDEAARIRSIARDLEP